MSNQLVISFFFPPSDYVSGITVAKRIIENNEPVDVIHADLTNNANLEFNYEVNRYIDNRISINVGCNNDWVECIFKFVDNGLNAIKNDYEKIYSRSWLMANHFLACEYKFLNNDTFWCAEFSDPLIYDLSNNEKYYDEMIIDNQKYIDKINNQILILNQNNNTQFSLIENGSSAYFIAEYLVYLFADKILFTNQNQREIMLRQFPVDLYDFVISKSEIKRHPILPDKYYNLKDSNIKLDDDFINIAFFGSDYYSKRNFESLFYAMDSLNHKYKDKIKLYIFINEKKLIKKLISTLNVKNNIVVRKPLGYLEFLNAATKFNVLVVNDVQTKGNYKFNPYLPSKLSDYLGSSTDIWAIVEKGSVLSNETVKYKSFVDDFKSCGNVLVNILHDNSFVDEEYTFDEYFIKRLYDLNLLYEKEFRKNKKLKKELKKLKKDKSRKRFKIF